MSHITAVNTVGGDMIDIHLQNGNIMLLSIEILLSDPRFAALKEDDRILYPKTDGTAIYWRDGQRLVLAEALRLFLADNCVKEEIV